MHRKKQKGPLSIRQSIGPFTVCRQALVKNVIDRHGAYKKSSDGYDAILKRVDIIEPWYRRRWFFGRSLTGIIPNPNLVQCLCRSKPICNRALYRGWCRPCPYLLISYYARQVATQIHYTCIARDLTSQRPIQCAISLALC